MKNLLIITALLFSGTYMSAQNLEAEYLQKENSRIALSLQTEEAIEAYIAANISSYNLTQAKLDEVSTEILESGARRALTGTELQDAINNAKKEELRKLYFQTYPAKAANFTAAPLAAAIACTNGGFETATTAGYSFFYNHFTPVTQQNSNWVLYNNIPQTPYTATTTSPKITLVQGGTDPITGLPRTNSGNYAIRLNDTGAGNTDVSRMTKTFTVTQNSISFSFAVVLQDGGHLNATPPHNPYFQYRVLQGSQVLVDYRVTANPNTAIFHPLAGGILYTDWICENIDVSDYINQDITLEFIVADCGQTAHKGYVYLDDFCGVACTAPALGDVTLNPVNANCPTFPLTVTGTFVAPTNNTLTSLTLQVVNSAGTVVGVVMNPTISGNTFSFNVNQVHFFGSNPVSPGNFEFRAIGVFTLNNSTFQTTLTDFGANQGADVSFTNCITGSILLNPVNENCPLYPLNVSGSYTVAQGTTVSNLTLQVINSAGTVVGVVGNPVVSGNTFTFAVNEINFGPAPLSGNFEFRVIGTATSGGFTIQLTRLSANPGADVSFADCSLCCANCCVDNQSLASPVLINYVDTRQANMRIQAVNIIHSGAFASYHAGNFVLLKPGFNAVSGSRVHIYNEGCTGTYLLRQATDDGPSKDVAETGTAKNESTDVTTTVKAELVRIENQHFISIHPNPNNGIFRVRLTDIDKGTIEVTDLLGMAVYKKSFDKTGEFEIDIQNKPRGIYIVRVITDNRIITEKIIKK